MRTVFVLFDSLNRLALGAYGGEAVPTPNFDRFAKRSMVFEKHYAGSLPCIPARRDMHTGRLNLMHRSWGPLEPFDNSFPHLLSGLGVYSHIVTDHHHYFEDGGTGYVTAFDSWRFVPGQEYNPLRATVAPPLKQIGELFDSTHYPLNGLRDGTSLTRHSVSEAIWRRTRGAMNRLELEERGERAWPLSQCFDGALEFLADNRQQDNWVLQIECFDPHEPFHAPERFRGIAEAGSTNKTLDWPVYSEVAESPQEMAEIRANYAALVAFCDAQFGRLLDWLDEEGAWENTCVILTTDHGFLLGEHAWWGKNKMPCYEEIAHIPLMIHYPEGRTGRYSGLTQTIALMPTILELHGAAIPEEVCGQSLLPALSGSRTVRDTAILGMFAGPLGIVDSRYFLYLYPPGGLREAMSQYTLSPAHIDRAFSASELQTARLSDPLPFTKGIKVLVYDAVPPLGEAGFEAVMRAPERSPLYDLETDPRQEHPIENDDVRRRLERAAAEHLAAHDAPPEVFAYYGLTQPSTHASEMARCS